MFYKIFIQWMQYDVHQNVFTSMELINDMNIWMTYTFYLNFTYTSYILILFQLTDYKSVENTSF